MSTIREHLDHIVSVRDRLVAMMRPIPVDALSLQGNRAFITQAVLLVAVHLDELVALAETQRSSHVNEPDETATGVRPCHIGLTCRCEGTEEFTHETCPYRTTGAQPPAPEALTALQFVRPLHEAAADALPDENGDEHREALRLIDAALSSQETGKHQSE